MWAMPRRERMSHFTPRWENPSEKTAPCREQKEEEYINFKLTWFLQAYDSIFKRSSHELPGTSDKHLSTYLSF